MSIRLAVIVYIQQKIWVKTLKAFKVGTWRLVCSELQGDEHESRKLQYPSKHSAALVNWVENNVSSAVKCVCVIICPQNGFLSALPYMGCAVVAVLSGQIADYLRETCQYRTVVVRKVFSLIGKSLQPHGLLDFWWWLQALGIKNVTFFCWFCRNDWASGVPGGSRLYRLQLHLGCSLPHHLLITRRRVSLRLQHQPPWYCSFVRIASRCTLVLSKRSFGT